jgi:hypothetical protein
MDIQPMPSLIQNACSFKVDGKQEKGDSKGQELAMELPCHGMSIANDDNDKLFEQCIKANGQVLAMELPCHGTSIANDDNDKLFEQCIKANIELCGRVAEVSAAIGLKNILQVI